MIESHSITKCDGCGLTVTKYFHAFDDRNFHGWAELKIVERWRQGVEWFERHYCPDCVTCKKLAILFDTDYLVQARRVLDMNEVKHNG